MIIRNNSADPSTTSSIVDFDKNISGQFIQFSCFNTIINLLHTRLATSYGLGSVNLGSISQGL